MLTLFGALVVGALCYFGGKKALRWHDTRVSQKMLEGAMLAEIEEDAVRRRPSEEEIWKAERELDEDLEDLVT